MNRRLLDSVYKHSMIFAAIFFVLSKSMDLYYDGKKLNELKISNNFREALWHIKWNLEGIKQILEKTYKDSQPDPFDVLTEKYLGNGHCKD